MAAALRLGNLAFQAPIEPACFQTLTVARDRDMFQAQVDPDRFLGRGTLFNGLFHRQAEPPVPHRILREAALTPVHPIQTLGLEYPERLAAEAQRATFALQTCRPERDPAEGATRAATHTPTQPAPLRGR